MRGGEFVHGGEEGRVKGEELGGAIELVLGDKGTRDNLYSLIEKGVGPDELREELASIRQTLNKHLWPESPDYKEQSARVRAMRDVEKELGGERSREVMDDLTRIAGELKEGEAQQVAAKEQTESTPEPVQPQKRGFWGRLREG